MGDRDVIDVLEELLAWTKFANQQNVVEALRRTLRDRAAFLAYIASDGSRSQGEVARMAGVSQPTISRMWGQWRRLGLLRDVEGRSVHLIDPADLGLVPPE